MDHLLPVGRDPGNATTTFVLRASGISKSFPGVRALTKVDFDLLQGEVHGLVGANGAGKSTLIRILTGAETADRGVIELQGVPDANSANSRQQQIASIYQELTIIPQMTALSNAFLGNTLSRSGLIARRDMLRLFEAQTATMGVSLPPMARASSLSIADQQLIEILRAVLAAKRILIMDEPTAPLGPNECQKLYELIDKLRDDGVSIIYVSHNLDEVLSLCDRVSVMREGQLVACAPSSRWNKEALVKAMLGDVKIVPGRKASSATLQELLSVQDVTVPGVVHDMTFSLRRGEILGIAGLVGSGRTELLRALAGIDPNARGRIMLKGESRALPKSVREAIGLGIVMAPEDRKVHGLVLAQTSQNNLMLPDLARDTTATVVHREKRLARATGLADRLGFNPARLGIPARNLSGGNQQKLVLGKWLNLAPNVLLLDEPTRGIDLGAKQEIFNFIRDVSDAGMAVILVSSDIDEVIEHSDRVLVMAGGRQLAVLEGAEATMEMILGHIFAVDRVFLDRGGLQ